MTFFDIVGGSANHNIPTPPSTQVCSLRPSPPPQPERDERSRAKANHKQDRGAEDVQLQCGGRGRPRSYLQLCCYSPTTGFISISIAIFSDIDVSHSYDHHATGRPRAGGVGADGGVGTTRPGLRAGRGQDENQKTEPPQQDQKDQEVQRRAPPLSRFRSFSSLFGRCGL